ncbi:nucleoside/nucleotide kinase family protein [Cellulomonas sp. PhB143]|uniref:nucleoside/nucleotide kinase family protein n=1 Tax=Cellulomonas sp. PhB143 TaxID=2485186 RepID=UPI000FB70CE3|nr:nucleoside/nucleotide kinase family protein [Cellulomonas sp. PhB143]ROS76822.1 phosphoribulokinase/uridine kinase family protein [Cellulomonas sp. PhB143]
MSAVLRLPDGAAAPALAGRAAALLAAGRGRRVLVGVVGAPGAGKSTLASAVADELVEGAPARPARRAVVVPMDGFHLADAELVRLGRRDRKGAPDTFDAEGFVALLRRLREDAPGPVYAPEFRREVEDPVAGAVRVDREVRVVVVEGNYLLLGERWAPVRDLLDETWFVDLPDDVRRARLVARHTAHGKAPGDAKAWVLGPDETNARLVAATRERADVVVRLGAAGAAPAAQAPPVR